MSTRLRNVWVEFSSAPGITQGGMFAADTMTNRQFLNCLHVAFTANGGFLTYKAGSATPIEVNDQILEHGVYRLSPVVQGEAVTQSNKRYYIRTLSLSDTSRDNAFMRDVRRRDGRCVITHRINVEAPINWTTYEAAHIFPLSLSSLFTQIGLRNTIEDDRGVNSPKNGILLKSDIHQLWDTYSIAVNPSDNYRVQSFRPISVDYHNMELHPVCRDPNDPNHVLDVLLQWHYEQAILANMWGAGEVIFEHDFPPGTDMLGEIRQAPMAAERMEAELFGRLYGYGEESVM
ncbi:hypothetical protein MauCBS54593_002141 [Microsporum audouinii]